ncbi:MAG: branched-chain amino acid aminotransferase [Christensenellaceae bacterium]|nr:branched-chain amino acid aminotransferase [Christensenellaceae bacterium]
MEKIKIIRATALKEKPKDESALVFGKSFTDYMFTMEFSSAKGWHSPTIKPYAPLSIDPANLTLHYGQSLFEGMKAYRDAEGGVRLFRPADNFARMSIGAQRLAMVPLDEEMALAGLKALLEIEKDWIPRSPGTSLYIRPTMMAMDAFLGVHASDSYLFFIILSPVAAYYKEGLKPVKIYVEDEYVRAARGGIGYTKAAANYVASMLAGSQAEKRGYSQVLWLDAVERKYIEEVGAMNIFFVIGGKLVTPPLRGSILAGITRNSVIQLAKAKGLEVEERPISIDEVFEAAQSGAMSEAFGSGTAAVISPVGHFSWKGEEVAVNGGKMGKIAQDLYDSLTAIQYGRAADPFGWSIKL